MLAATMRRRKGTGLGLTRPEHPVLSLTTHKPSAPTMPKHRQNYSCPQKFQHSGSATRQTPKPHGHSVSTTKCRQGQLPFMPRSSRHKLKNGKRASRVWRSQFGAVHIFLGPRSFRRKGSQSQLGSVLHNVDSSVAVRGSYVRTCSYVQYEKEWVIVRACGFQFCLGRLLMHPSCGPVCQGRAIHCQYIGLMLASKCLNLTRSCL